MAASHGLIDIGQSYFSCGAKVIFLDLAKRLQAEQNLWIFGVCTHFSDLAFDHVVCGSYRSLVLRFFTAEIHEKLLTFSLSFVSLEIRNNT